MTTLEPIAFDHFDPAFSADPYPQLAQLRSSCPVAHTDARGGFWVVSGYDEIRSASLNTDEFSSSCVSVPRPSEETDLIIPPLNLDPPAHRPYKRLLATALTASKVAALEDVTQQFAIESIEKFERQGACDASYDYARLLPIAVLTRLLGLPDGMEEQFSQWVRQLLDNESSGDSHTAAFLSIQRYIAETIAERKEKPGDDLLSYLLEAELDGRRLAEGELVLIGLELLVAGIDTTWNLLGSSLLHLATHPDDQRALRADPSLLKPAAEEFLRAFAPVMIGRTIASDTELGGCPMKAGELVLLALNSACRDANAFPDPDEVRLNREPNPHVAFGLGIHRCLGSNLARMEIVVGLREFLARVPEFRLDESKQVSYSAGQIRGPVSVPILF